MKVKFLKAWSDFSIGAIADIPDHLALAIMVEDIAALAEDQGPAGTAPAGAPECATVAAPEQAVLPQPKPKGRRRKAAPPPAEVSPS